jgi:hypothetical protein
VILKGFIQMRRIVLLTLALAAVAPLLAPANAGGGNGKSNPNDLTQGQLFELQVFATWLRNKQLQDALNQPQYIPPPPEHHPAPPPPPEQAGGPQPE